jgi:Flp pilus assembly protein TadG
MAHNVTQRDAKPGFRATRPRRNPGELGEVNSSVPGGPCRPRSLKGQTMVEFALVAPLFFFLIFALLDFGRMFFVQMNLQQAVQEAGRFASTGNHLPDPKKPGQNFSRVDSIIAAAKQEAWGADIANIQISSLAGGSGSAGGPGDTVTVSLTSNLKLMTPFVGQFFPNGAYTFTSSATFRNEPFPPGNTK